MIRKIISLRGIGRFEGYHATGDVEFKKYTLIFAENGVGKSTICDVIRSLQMGDADYIMGRRTLGAAIEPAAEIRLLDGSSTRFTSGRWSHPPQGRMAIFDAGFVRDNVHAGEIVVAGHRRNLFQVIVGHDGVALAKLVEDLERQKTELNTPIRTAKQAIEAALPNGMTLKNFLAMKPDPDIDQKIVSAEQSLKAAQQIDAVRRHRGIAPLPLPELPAAFQEILSTTLEGVSEEAERRLNAHLEHLGGDQTQRWLAHGVGLIRDDECPFCRQSLDGNDLVAAYRTCFSEVYGRLSERAAALPRLISDAVGDGAVARIEALSAQNSEAATFWTQYCEVTPPPEIDLARIKAAFAELHAAAMSLAERKSANLLEAIGEDNRFTLARDAFSATIAELRAYNASAERTGEVIEGRRAALSGTDLSTAILAVKQTHAHKARFEEPLVTTCAHYSELSARKDGLDEEKRVAKERLDAHTRDVIERHESALNRHLRNFMTSFRVRGTRAEYPRGMPSSSYHLVINEVEVELGNEDSSPAHPTFRNTLSGGDRSALALSFFMSQLELAPDRADTTVVLDDPFQSQDGFRRNATAFQIKRCGEMCAQVIVLSHDPQFLKLVWDELPRDQRKALRLNAVGTLTTMSEWDIAEHFRGVHQANIDAIQRYLDSGVGELRAVAMRLRPALEGYCKIVCPGEFDGDGIMMGEIIRRVRLAGPGHVLHGILPELEELNGYARRYHHATNPDAATENLVEGELQGYSRLVLELMRIRPSRPGT